MIDRRMVLGGGGAAIVLGAAGHAAAETTDAAQLTQTPPVELGPFYPVRHPMDSDSDLTRIRGRNGRAAGQVIEVTGRVMDARGRPVPRAQIDLWQANHLGRYAHDGDSNPAALDPNFQGFARMRSGGDGAFRILTVKPGAYPATATWTRPPHLHFLITGRANLMSTQMFFPDEAALNAKDLLFAQIPVADASAAIARVLPARADGVTRLAYDIVLAVG